jgi:hypothetical protein
MRYDKKLDKLVPMKAIPRTDCRWEDPPNDQDRQAIAQPFAGAAVDDIRLKNFPDRLSA